MIVSPLSVLMEDLTFKSIKDLKVNDQTYFGKVTRYEITTVKSPCIHISTHNLNSFKVTPDHIINKQQAGSLTLGHSMTDFLISPHSSKHAKTNTLELIDFIKDRINAFEFIKNGISAKKGLKFFIRDTVVLANKYVSVILSCPVNLKNQLITVLKQFYKMLSDLIGLQNVISLRGTNALNLAYALRQLFSHTYETDYRFYYHNGSYCLSDTGRSAANGSVMNTSISRLEYSYSKRKHNIFTAYDVATDTQMLPTTSGLLGAS